MLLLCWLVAVLLAQSLPAPWLQWAALLLLSAALVLAPQRCRQLLRRIRILALMIVILFAWFTPGEALWVKWIALAPSHEGLQLALLHLSRLLLAVTSLVLLLEYLPTVRLLSGLHALSRPFVVFGLSPERFALRLMLVLQLVDATTAAGKRGDWRYWLDDGRAEFGELGKVGDGGEEYRIEVEPLRALDRLACTVLVVGVICWSVW
ncbi:MAG: CbiQ family ECF transporter T component [Thauera sp.]|nr:CbiQ family ECF transporter T component [Thauera sp.]